MQAQIRLVTQVLPLLRKYREYDCTLYATNVIAAEIYAYKNRKCCGD